jgi:two-component system phosphate regulon response regulator PhoB
MSKLILIVDDEASLVETLDYNLRRDGYATRAAFDGREALNAIKRVPHPDLVLLDLNLPGLPGLDVCRAIRQDPATRDIPVIMLTAMADEVDRIVGFQLGADDYVTKPFSVRELLLRVRAVLRRGETPSEGTVLVAGALRIDVPAHRVWVEDVEVVLTALEFKLLATFLSRRGRVQTREMLLSEVWDIHADISTRTVDTHVKRLREKLGPAGELIETLRGVGYRFTAQIGADPS